jgi:diguanylate cyclase (GGDEF)-like protein
MALAYSSAIFIVSIFICFSGFQHLRANDTLIQYFITMIMYIAFIYFFQVLVSNYLESDILRNYAFEDPLTRIGNRRLIDSWIDQQMDKSLQHHLPLSIIYFDIDHFKNINDQYGHDVGDHILKEFVLEIKRQIERTDCFFGRWGGEEFILICPNHTSAMATETAEMLRQSITNHHFQPVRTITASFGVTGVQLNDEYKTLLARADRALYIAKESGRNRVVTI